MAPESLVQQFASTKGRIDGATATFGAPFYGERILGRLVWADPTKDGTHCSLGDYSMPAPDEVGGKEMYQEVRSSAGIVVDGGAGRSHKQVRLINIIMVRRGGCSFFAKVWAARSKGAHAVIVVDRESSAATAQEIRKVIVSDGDGRTIDIPSILIAKEDGARLIEAAKASQVIVELAWDVPTNNIVVMDLWMSPASHQSLRFLQEFSPTRKALKENVRFVPHYHVTSSTCRPRNVTTSAWTRYCGNDPDGPGYITGRMVLEEDIRQLCIHELTKASQADSSTAGPGESPATGVEYAEKFWSYVESLLAWCPPDASQEPHFGRECSEGLMRKVGIDVEAVKLCASETWEEKLDQELRHTAWSPHALRINGWRYQGNLDVDLVTRAICAAFVRQPPACAALMEPGNPSREDRPASIGGLSFITFLVALACLSLSILGAFKLYKRSLTRHIHSALRQEVMLEVQAQMDSYEQLS